jgi:hypothetical protein
MYTLNGRQYSTLQDAAYRKMTNNLRGVEVGPIMDSDGYIVPKSEWYPEFLKSELGKRYRQMRGELLYGI